LQKQFLEIKIVQFDKDKEFKQEVRSVYKVDLYTLAIGPVHHSIEMVDSVRLASHNASAAEEVLREALLRHRVFGDEAG